MMSILLPDELVALVDLTFEKFNEYRYEQMIRLLEQWAEEGVPDDQQ